MFYKVTFVWSHLSCSLTRSPANTHRFGAGGSLTEPSASQPYSLAMQDKHIPESRSATHARGWPICNHILYSWDSKKLFAPGSFQHRFHARIWTNFLRLRHGVGKQAPACLYVQEVPQLCCFWFLWPANAINIPSHRSMWQRLSSQRGILVISRDREKV